MRWRPSHGYPGGTVSLISHGLIGPLLSGLSPAVSTDPIDENEAAILDRGDYQLAPPVSPETFQGLELPVQVGENGRALLISGREQTKKLLYIAFQDCDSDNEFQRLGVDRGIIFDMNDPLSLNKAELEMIQIGKAFSDRLKVIEDEIAVRRDPDVDGDVNGYFQYLEIETGEIVGASVPIT